LAAWKSSKEASISGEERGQAEAAKKSWAPSRGRQKKKKTKKPPKKKKDDLMRTRFASKEAQREQKNKVARKGCPPTRRLERGPGEK